MRRDCSPLFRVSGFLEKPIWKLVFVKELIWDEFTINGVSWIFSHDDLRGGEKL